MPAGTSTYWFDDAVVVRLRSSWAAIGGCVVLVLLALALGAMAFAPDDDGTRTPWFATAALLTPAVLALVGAAFAWRWRSGTLAIGRDGVRIVSPGHGIIELAHDAIRTVDAPVMPADWALRLGGPSWRRATLVLKLYEPVNVLVAERIPVGGGTASHQPFDVLVVAPRRWRRVRQALANPPYEPLPPRPAAIPLKALVGLRAIAVAGAPLLVLLAAVFLAGGFVALQGDSAPASAAADDGLPPALPGFKGTFFRSGTASGGGARVYAWHVGRAVSVRVDSPPLRCGPDVLDWDAQIGSDLPLGATGRFRGTWRDRVYLTTGGYRDVTLTVAGRLADDAVRVAFTRVDQYGGSGGTARCARSGTVLLGRARRARPTRMAGDERPCRDLQGLRHPWHPWRAVGAGCGGADRSRVRAGDRGVGGQAGR